MSSATPPEDAGRRRRFRSRVDPAIGALLGAVVLNCLGALVLARLQTGAVPPALGVTLFGAALVLIALVAGTYAVLEPDRLVVRMAWVLRREIPYVQITQVTRVNSWQKSAALSSRRLRIAWQQPALPWRSMIDVSPRAEAEFIALLHGRVPAAAWAVTETQTLR